MDFKFQKSQAVKLLLLLLSLTLIPFVSTSLRPSYLYFLLNILIIVLGYESGILHVLLEPATEKKKPAVAVTPVSIPDNRGSNNSANKARDGGHGKPAVPPVEEKPPTAADKVATVAKLHKVNKSPSVPSLFFIGTCDGNGEAAMEDVMEEEDEDVFVAVGEISAQELFTRAESFIGNFYRQLKIQREESWKKIHDFYHKPF